MRAVAGVQPRSKSHLILALTHTPALQFPASKIKFVPDHGHDDHDHDHDHDHRDESVKHLKRGGRVCEMENSSDYGGNDHDHPDHNNALRIQTENLISQSLTATPTRIPSTRSISSINGSSYTSSPIITPSGSHLHIPSSALTPLPSPLVAATGQFPSSLSLDSLVLGSSPRRKGYGALGVLGSYGERRNATEFVPVNGSAGLGLERNERSVSSGLTARTGTDEGLRREEVHTPRSRTSSVADEVFVHFLPPGFRVDTSRTLTFGARTMIIGSVRRCDI
jgi:hypothetical protein